MVALRSQGNWKWEGPLGTPLGLVHWKRASSPVEAGTVLFFSISFHWLLRKAFLSLLAILWNSAFNWVYLSFSPLLFTSLVFTGILKASSDSHIAVLHFFFLGMVFLTAFCTMSRTSTYSSSGTLSIRSSPLKLFLTSTV